MKEKGFRIKTSDIIISLSIILLIIVIFNAITISNTYKRINEIKTAEIPAKIEITTIKNSECADCFNIDSIAEEIKRKKVNVTKETTLEFDSDEAKELIKKYSIEKIPAIIVNGEINKTGNMGLIPAENALIFKDVKPPYSTADGKIKGLVNLTLVKKQECDNCTDLSLFVTSLKKMLKITNEQELEANSKEAKELIEKYNITKLPALILSNDALLYEDFKKVWQQLGTEEDDGNLILKQINPPYYDLKDKEVKGLVELTMLVDKSCEGCYNVTIHKPILAGFGVKIVKENIVDVSSKEGKSLIEEYNITAVPTILLSSDAKLYISLKNVWQSQVGTIEDNGMFVFRNIKVMGVVYKDLSTGEIINSTKANPTI